MSFFGWGNPALRSGDTGSFGLATNPTTATILAEIDFNGTNATILAGGRQFGVTWIVGTLTTNAVFRLEQVQSTALDLAESTVYRDQITVPVSSAASAQYFTKHTIHRGDRLRVRLNSSTPNAAAWISAEPMV